VRTRAISSIGVVIVGLVPALLGGWAFVLLMMLLGIVGYHELRRMSAHLSPTPRVPVAGYAGVALLGAGAMIEAPSAIVLGLLFLTMAVAMLEQFPHADERGLLTGWAIAVSGTLYLGIPVFAAISLRQAAGGTDSAWFTSFADRVGLLGPGTSLGLAWVLLVILCTWIGDSGAYLVGRSLGKHKLAPVLSPKKTIEGSLGGLLGTIIVAVVVDAAFGMGLAAWATVVLGALLGAAGQVGDLAESLMKRQAGVKDSGSIIPGHGGILDRIDALLFAFPVGVIAAWLLGVL